MKDYWMVKLISSAKVEHLPNELWRVTFGDENIPETIIECAKQDKNYFRYYFSNTNTHYNKTIRRKIKSSDGKAMIDAAIIIYNKSEYIKRRKIFQQD